MLSAILNAVHYLLWRSRRLQARIDFTNVAEVNLLGRLSAG